MAILGLSKTRALVLGTLTVGVLDIADALIFFGLRGVRPIRLFQSIASGLLGRVAYSGGMRTAVLGAVLHFFIAFVIVATFLIASRYFRVLLRAPVLTGLLYGLAVYLVMNFVVLPLSAAGRGPLSWPVAINGILIHMLGVGLPSSLIAKFTGVRPGPF